MSANSTVHRSDLFQMDAVRICVICFYTLLLVIGLCANGWVATILIRLLTSRKYTKAPASRLVKANTRSDATRCQIQLYILSLCICDLVILFFLSFLLIDLIFGEWIVASPILCRLYLTTEGLNKFGSPFLLLALSGFCYSSVIVATNNKRKHACAQAFARTSTTICLIVCCALAVALLSAPLYLYGDIHSLVIDHEASAPSGRDVTKCGFLPPHQLLTAFVIYGFVLGYVIPAGAFTFFYVNLVRLVRRRQSGGREARVIRLARVSWTSIVLVAFYLISWTPYWILALWQYAAWSQQNAEGQSIEQQSQVIVALSYFVHILPYANCTGFPILYVLSNTTIKEAYTRLRRCEPGHQYLDMETRNMSSVTRSCDVRNDSL